MKTKTRAKSKSKSIPAATCPPDATGVTIGIDLGDKHHAIHVLDPGGAAIDERRITNRRESLRRLSKKHPGSRIVMEAGSHSPWTSRFFQDLGHEVIVANARKLRAIYENDRKSDELDALMLAKLGRLDPSLLHPIEHQDEEAQRDLLQIKLRDTLVRQRVNLISSVRFTLKSLGHRLASPGTNCFAKHARETLGGSKPELLALIEPTLRVIDVLTGTIKELGANIEKLGREKYPETQRLRRIAGIGPITALAYRLTVGDPERFAKSRGVGAYFGLAPKRDQSGTLDKELRISKAGNAYVRKLLVGAAHYILGPFGPDTDLRRAGLKLEERGGRAAKKKAVVATARKLAVLMHALWIGERDYEPLRGAARA